MLTETVSRGGWGDPLRERAREGIDLEVRVDSVWIPAFAGMMEYFDFASVFVAPAKAGTQSTRPGHRI
jgi:hypothetical protein